MTLNDLLQQLSAAQLHPIPVEGEIDLEQVRGMRFRGDFDAFVKAAKALDSRCVFVATKTLQESDFSFRDIFAQPADDIDEEAEASDSSRAPIDLVAAQPKLGEFKRRLGQGCGVRFWVHVHDTTLEYVHHAPWWQEFVALRDGVFQALDDQRKSAWSKRAEEEERKTKELLARLRDLINDDEFARLPTQRAMLAYAMEQIPGLDSIKITTLRAEIQMLDAKIKAKGPGRKK